MARVAVRVVRQHEALSALLDQLGAPSLSPIELKAIAAELDGSLPLTKRRRRPSPLRQR